MADRDFDRRRESNRYRDFDRNRDFERIPDNERTSNYERTPDYERRFDEGSFDDRTYDESRMRERDMQRRSRSPYGGPGRMSDQQRSRSYQYYSEGTRGETPQGGARRYATEDDDWTGGMAQRGPRRYGSEDDVWTRGMPQGGQRQYASSEEDWARDIPQNRTRLPYSDYGWESGQSVLPQFQDPEIRERMDWTQPGPHTGRGPRGYRRSDDRIFEDVCERLSRHGQIDASDITVKVDDGEVSLTGTVDNRRTKRMVEDVAESVNGVRDVRNELRVQQNPGNERGMQGYGTGAATRSGTGTQTGMQTGGGQFGESSTSRSKWRLAMGMDVLGSDGTNIGMVKTVRDNDFLVDRPLARDIYVPFSACQSVENNQVRINVSPDQIDQQGWPSPEVAGSNG